MTDVDAEIAYAAVDDIGDGGLRIQCRVLWRQARYGGLGEGGSASQMLPCSRFQRRRAVTPPETRRFGADAVAVALRPTAVGAEVGQQTAMLQTRESPDQPPLQFPRTTGGSQAMRAESRSVNTTPRRSRCESPRIAVDSDGDTGVSAQRHRPHLPGRKASRGTDRGQFGVGGPQHDMAPQLRMRAGEAHRLIQFSHRDTQPHRGGFQPRVQRFTRPRCSAQRERAQRSHRQ